MPIKLITNAKIVTLAKEKGYGIIKNGTIAIKNGKIVWVGSSKKLPEIFFSKSKLDMQGRLITPAPIDCHTHIIFAGNRAKEFEMRLTGSTYEEIAKAGGGIVSTVSATRNSSREELIEMALVRLDQMIAQGVTTIEIKSGYGLDNKTEIEMLRCAKILETKRKVRVFTSFLGAHAIPKEYSGQPDKYLEEICIPTLKEAKSENLVDYVDGFCEKIAFNVTQMEKVFQVAKNLDIPIKLHAEQLSHSGGTRLAAKFSAISVDHLEYANELDVASMAKAGSVAVLLPGAYYTLREKKLPPVWAFRNSSVPMAVATDCNPGSSPLTSILLALNMACTIFELTPEEALRGITVNAAKALGRKDIGKIAIDQKADLAIWDVSHPSELSYRIGYNPLYQRIFGGE